MLKKTSLIDLKNKADAVENLNIQQVDNVIQFLIGIIQPKLNVFLQSLQISLMRSIKKVVVQPLFGTTNIFQDALSAQQYLSAIDLNIVPNNLTCNWIFIFVEYSNGENFRAEFLDKISALDFLSKF